ncbi:LuxR C-terminal-related transcriptional regulator [Streptomyces sp. NPDC002920]
MNTVPGNLPNDLSSFVGRRRELSVARELMTASRLLLLTGAGGVGKTRLARRLAEETRRAFPHGAWIIELADVGQEGFVAQNIATTLHLRDDTLDPLDHLRAHLVDKKMLLLVDNCEHLVAECAKVIGDLLAASPELRVIATSRQVLGVAGEQVYPVPPLALSPLRATRDDLARMDADAVTLFCERARAANPEFLLTDDNWPVVSEICRRLDGVPLAIELAVGRLRALSESQILDRLDNALDLLTVGPRTMPARQQRIEATLSWSYQLSTPAEQRLWRCLSVFAGGFTLEAVEEMSAGAGVAWPELLGALSGLVEKSILVRRLVGGQPRYHLSEVLRQYGRKRLAESGEEQEMLRRHLDHYSRLAARGVADYCSPRDREWMESVRGEHPNLRNALEHALSAPGTARQAMSIAAGLRPFWTHSGLLQEGYTWLRRALAADRALSDDRLWALSACTNLALMLADVDMAVELLAECKAMEPIADNARFSSQIAFHDALAAFLHSGPAEATRIGTDAVARSLALEDVDAGLAAQAIAALSLFAFLAEDPSAPTVADEFKALTQRHGSHLLDAVAAYAVGLNRWREDSSDAEALLCEPIDTLVDFQEQAFLAATLEVLAWAAATNGEDRRAAELFGFVDGLWQHAKLFIAHLIAEAIGGEIREQTRRRLGPRGWSEAVARGSALGYTEGLDLARRIRAPEPAPSVAGAPARGRRRVTAGTPLTPRETQIAQLVADGLSNKEIASRLVLSVRTAEAHVENILTKLSFRSRTQIAAWVHKHLAAGTGS